jgi:hypothetical protein
VGGRSKEAAAGEFSLGQSGLVGRVAQEDVAAFSSARWDRDERGTEGEKMRNNSSRILELRWSSKVDRRQVDRTGKLSPVAAAG